MPTEKDVQYYEELVRCNVADKETTLGCKIQVEGSQSICTILGQNYPDLYVQFEGKKEPTVIPYPGYIFVLGHEIRPHHLLLRLEKVGIYGLFTTKRFMISYRSDKYFNRDLSKSFSGQSDEVKIELGKVVESVLSSKDE